MNAIEKILEFDFSNSPFEKNLNQLRDISLKIRTKINLLPQNNFKSSNDTIELTLVKIYAQFFPEKIAYQKTITHAVSLNGRGLKLNQYTEHQKTNDEYLIVLAARENESQDTLVQGYLKFSKKIAFELFQKFAIKKTEYIFDTSHQQFYKTEQLIFENIILNDFGKTRLSPSEIQSNWKSMFQENPRNFLQFHSVFDKINQKIDFILKKNDLFFKLEPQQINNFICFEQLLSKKIIDSFDHFEDFKNTQLEYFVFQALPEKEANLLESLPDIIKSPSGRTFEIDYVDEKAPLISLKLQYAFGWNDTPCITLSNGQKLLITLVLLAPNMRPTQITNQLNRFWQNSYLDVRKELKARYPKHDWPENPLLQIKVDN